MFYLKTIQNRKNYLVTWLYPFLGLQNIKKQVLGSSFTYVILDVSQIACWTIYYSR